MTKKAILAREVSSMMDGLGPVEITGAAIHQFRPAKIFVGFSGGFDSLVTTHWMMNNIRGCEVFHANTGIGIERTREFVRHTCDWFGWPLTEIRAKEDCGQDYDEMVIAHGFPGPGHHYKMFQRLKERCVRKLVAMNKTKVSDCVMIATGIRKDESARRAGYKYSVIDHVGSAMWVNPFYYRSREWFSAYIKKHQLPQNPVSKLLGMSGECLCGAYAHSGELALVKMVCPATHDRIRALEARVRDAGHAWGWEEKPPKKVAASTGKFMPFCVGCEKEDRA